MATEEEKTSFIAQPLTPTSMVLDLGCTSSMASRVAAQGLMKFCDHNPDCGIWYHVAETTSQFTFPNSESTKCNQKLVVRMYDREYVVQSTECDIVEQGHVPILMSLPQMRNLRFQFELHPDKALLSSPVLGIWDVKLKVAPSSHLVLDLLDLSRFLWNVRFDKHKKSSFLTYFTHYEYGFHQKTLGSFSQEEVPKEFALATDDEWVIDEANMELIRVHKQMRKALCQPKDGLTPIPLEFLDTKRKTIMEFQKGKSVVKEDDWSSSELPAAKATESWKGRTIFRILAGGIESRTSVPAKSRDPTRGKKGSPGDIISKGKWGERTKGSVPPGTVPEVAAPPAAPEDDPDLQDIDPSLPGDTEEFPRGAPEVSSLEPRRIALPLPGQEVSRASPQYQRMLEKLNNDVELYKLHVKHYHMSPAQFRRRTKHAWAARGDLRQVRPHCQGLSCLQHLRANASASQNQEIKFSNKAYLALVIIDGASNLLWATALTSLKRPRLWELFVNGLKRTTVSRKELLVIRLSSPISSWHITSSME